MDQTITSPSITRIIQPTHPRTPSRSSCGNRILSDDILYDLTPEKTIDALSNPSNHLNASLAVITQNERAFILRVAVASKKIHEWYDELSGWPWPKAENFAGINRSPKEEVQCTVFPSTTSQIGETMRSDSCINFWGPLNESQIRVYETRIYEVHVATEELRVDEIKRQVLDCQFYAKTRPSSSCSTSSMPDVHTSTTYIKMDDFTAIVSAITLQVLPQLKKLSQLLEVWFKRICILRRIPILLTDLEDAEIAMKSGWNAIRIPDMDNELKCGQKSIMLTRQAFDVIRRVLQQKITSIGQSIDLMLDILEGCQDTLPATWLDRMEALVHDYEEWVIVAHSRVVKSEWLGLENRKSFGNITYELATQLYTSIQASDDHTGPGSDLFSTKKPIATDLTIAESADRKSKSLNQEESLDSKSVINSLHTEEVGLSTIYDTFSTQKKTTTETTSSIIHQTDNNLRPRQFLESDVSLPFSETIEANRMDLDIKTSSDIVQDEQEPKEYFSVREENSNCGSMLDGISASSELNYDDPSSKTFYILNIDTASKVCTKDEHTVVDFTEIRSSKNHIFKSQFTHDESPDVALDSKPKISTALSNLSSETTNLFLDGNDIAFSDRSETSRTLPIVCSSVFISSKSLSCNLQNNMDNGNLDQIFLNSSADEMTSHGISHISSGKFSEVDTMATGRLIDADSTTRNETDSVASSMLFLDQHNFNDPDQAAPKSLALSGETPQNSGCSTTHESINTLVSTNFSKNAKCHNSNSVMFSSDGLVESCYVERPINQNDNLKLQEKIRSVDKMLSKNTPILIQLSENAEFSISDYSKTENTTDGSSSKQTSSVMDCNTVDNTLVSKLFNTTGSSSHKEAGTEESDDFNVNGSPFFNNSSLPISSKTDPTLPNDILSSEHKSSSTIDSSQSNLSISYKGLPSLTSSIFASTKPNIIGDDVLSQMSSETRTIDEENLKESLTPTSQSTLTTNYLNKGKMSPVLEEALNAPPTLSIMENSFVDEDTDSDQKDESVKISPSGGYGSLSNDQSLVLGLFEDDLQSNDMVSSKINTSLTESFLVEGHSPSSGRINYTGNIYFNISPPDSPLMRSSKSRSISCGPDLSEPLELSEESRFRNNDTCPEKNPIGFDATEATKNDQFERQISSLLKSMPLISLSSESEPAKYNPESLQPREARPKIRSLKRQTSNISVRSSNSVASSTLTLSPVFGKTHSRTRYQNGNSEIRVYQLSRSTGEAPIKLFVRLVGEHGERVMVRVGGGWADLGEYLREYVSHHGRRSVIDNVKVRKVNSRTFSGSAKRVSSINRESGRSSPFQTPQSVEQRPRNTISIPRSRKSVGGNNSVESSNLRPSKDSFQYPSTPVPTIPSSTCKTPPSVASSNGSAASGASDRSSRMSWVEEEFNLGLAGPRSKKSTISDRDLEWVESMKEKVRLASAEKDRRHREFAERIEKSEKSRERGYSLGELERIYGPKRLFRRDGSVDL